MSGTATSSRCAQAASANHGAIAAPYTTTRAFTRSAESTMTAAGARRIDHLHRQQLGGAPEDRGPAEPAGQRRDEEVATVAPMASPRGSTLSTIGMTSRAPRGDVAPGSTRARTSRRHRA